MQKIWEQFEYVINGLFPSIRLEEKDVRNIKYILISRGSIKTGIEDDEKGIFVLDYDIVVDCLKKQDFIAVSEKIEYAIETHLRIEEAVINEVGLQNIRIGGYLIKTETLNQLLRNGEGAVLDNNLVSPNQRCPCGSGRPYKQCCQRVEEYL